MARLGPPFGPKNLPEKVYVYVPLLRPFPGNEAHKLFSGGQKWGVLDGGQKVYVENVYVLFRSPNDCGYPLSRYTCRATRVAADFSWIL